MSKPEKQSYYINYREERIYIDNKCLSKVECIAYLNEKITQLYEIKHLIEELQFLTFRVT